MSRSMRAHGATLGVLLVGLLTALPVSAAELGAGVVLGADAPDLALSVRSLGSAICYIDGDGNQAYTAGEPVLLRTTGGCSGDSSGRDLRLAAWEGLEPGQRLGAAADANKPLSAPSGNARFWYFDVDGNSRMGDPDVVYANLVNADRGFVDVGDVRLSAGNGFAAGSVVRSGDGDVSQSLRLLGDPSQAVGMVDTDDDGLFGASDLLYLNADLGDNELVEFGDLRLMSLDAGRRFGSFVSFGDADGAALLTHVTRVPCATDLDGSGGYSAGDGLYIDLNGGCGGSTSVGDVRLVSVDAGAAGTRIVVDDADLGVALIRVDGATIGYVDQDADARHGPADIAYLLLVAPASQRLAVGDVRLTPRDGASGVLEEGDGEFDRSVTVLGSFDGATAFVATEGSTSPGMREPFYLNMDFGGAEGVEAGDVRLVGLDDLPFGGPATLATGEVLPSLAQRGGDACFSPETGSTYTAGDPVYLSFQGCTSNLQAGAVRLVAIGGFAAGTVVRATDADHGAPLVGAAASYRFYDGDGDFEWSFGDTLYVDLVDSGSQRVHVGDIRVTPLGDADVLTAVHGADTDVNLPLQVMGSVSGRSAYVEGNANARFDAADIAYVDVDGTGLYVSILDVRLVALPEEPVVVPEPSPSPTASPSPTDTSSPEPTPSPSATTSPTTSPEPTETTSSASPTASPRGGEDVATPGPGVVLVLCVALGPVFMARRRGV